MRDCTMHKSAAPARPGPRMISVTAMLAAASVALSACEAKYQQKDAFGVGYSDMALMNDRFQISIEGNVYTSLPTAEQQFYRRAEELMKEKGYASYQVVQM